MNNKKNSKNKKPNYVGNIVTLPKIKLQLSGQSYYRVDLEFYGIDHSGPSYQGRVFINNTNANEKTKMTLTNGYAGSFNIFGHGGCFGDTGHCDVHQRRPYDHRASHPLTPAFKMLQITNLFNKLIKKSKKINMEITIIPIMSVGGRLSDMKDVVKLERIRINTYEHASKKTNS